MNLRAWKVVVPGYDSGIGVARSRGAAKMMAVRLMREVGYCGPKVWPNVKATRFPSADGMADVPAYHGKLMRVSCLPPAWKEVV